MLSAESTRNLLLCFLWVVKNMDQRVLRQWWADLPAPRLAQLLDVLYLAISNFEYKVGSVQRVLLHIHILGLMAALTQS